MNSWSMAEPAQQQYGEGHGGVSRRPVVGSLVCRGGGSAFLAELTEHRTGGLDRARGNGEWMMPNQAKAPAMSRVAAAGLTRPSIRWVRKVPQSSDVTMKPPESIVTVAIQCWVWGLRSANGLPTSGSTWLSVIRARYARAGTQARATAA